MTPRVGGGRAEGGRAPGREPRAGGATPQMRVIAGSARGVVLRGPHSATSRATTRPTASRLREALFSMLVAAGADFERVLDLYAGSGALGIEALSRGEGTATFVEADPDAVDAIRANLARTHLEARGEVVGARVGAWRPRADEAYTLVVADPPYDDAAAWAAIESSVTGALAAHAAVVVEHDARTPPPPSLGGRPLWQDRRQGAGAVAIYRPAGEDLA